MTTSRDICAFALGLASLCYTPTAVARSFSTDDIVCLWAGPIVSQYQFEHEDRTVMPGLELTAMHCEFPFVGLFAKSLASAGNRLDTVGLQLSGGYMGLEIGKSVEKDGGRSGVHVMPYFGFPTGIKGADEEPKSIYGYIGPTFRNIDDEVQVSVTLGLKVPIIGDLRIFSSRFGCDAGTGGAATLASASDKL